MQGTGFSAFEWQHSNIGGQNWHATTIAIATKNKELCSHANMFNILVAPEFEFGDPEQISFTVSCGVCKKTYGKTEKRLTEEFKKNIIS